MQIRTWDLIPTRQMYQILRLTRCTLRRPVTILSRAKRYQEGLRIRSLIDLGELTFKPIQPGLSAGFLMSDLCSL